jgi:hypothetical protein
VQGTVAVLPTKQVCLATVPTLQSHLLLSKKNPLFLDTLAALIIHFLISKSSNRGDYTVLSG